MPQEFEYFAILTNKGTEKLAQYLQSGEKLTISWVVVGDGNGSIPMPDPGRTALVHEVWRGPAQVTGDLVNKNVIKATSVIPTDVGGWNVREIGLIDQDGELFAIANAPGYPKISIADGINNDMCVGMRVAVSNQAGINIKVDGTVIIATIQDIEEHDKNDDSHKGHFKNKEIHVSTDDRENWDNPLIVATVLLESEDWKRDPEGVTFIQDVTGQLPEETVLPNMDLSIKADPNLTAQMVDKDIGLVAEQTGGKIVVHALREAPDINMYLQVSLYRSKSGEEKTYYSNLLGNPGEIGTPLPLPIEKGSIHLEDQSTAEQLKIHGTHTNPSIDWAATRVVRGENVGPIGPNDGVQIMDGTATEFTDTNNLKAGVRYIYAYFPRNEAGNYQMSATTAEITIPTKKPQPPTNLQIKNSTDASAFAATLTYEAPVDVYRDHFAIVRKEGSAPTSLEDGKIVYEGAELTFRDTQNTTFGVEYHWTVFAVNAEGVVSDASPSVSLSIQPIVPEQVTELTAADASAPEYGYRVMVKCKKPADVNAYKIMVRRKAGEMPATSIDGDQVYEGSNEIFYDLPPFSSQEYFYRAFTVNQSGQMNDEQEGAVASVTLTAKEPGSVTNLAATDEKGTTTGSFDLPVVMLEGKEVVNRFVAGYVVIQKEGSTPESETDGEVIASTDIDPAITSKTVTFTKTEQKNGANLFITVFLKNHAGSYFWSNGQVVNVVPQVIPTRYEFLECITGNLEWSPPENGVYRITCIGASASGTAGGTGTMESNPDDDNNHYGDWLSTYYGGSGGNGGGSGGISRSVLNLKEEDKIHCTVTSSVSSFGDSLSATAASGMNPGNGTGGNDFNTAGNNGGGGGKGGYHKALNGYPANSNTTYPTAGSSGGGNGAQGGQAFRPASYASEGGGGGGGGATYNLPAEIAYDDPMYTTYVKQNLNEFKGGDGANGRNGQAGPASSYPIFDTLLPVWHGGGNGGGGGCAGKTNSGRYGTPGTAGSPGGILIEKGVFD